MTVLLYTSPSCTSCRKAREWLDEHEIDYVEKNIFLEPLSNEEIKRILRLTEDGTEEIISKRSNAYQNLDRDINEMSLKELYQLIHDEPGILRRPIMTDNKRLQVGYNDEEMGRFLPRYVRVLELERARKLANDF
ncbi:transcriptional regulator SpxA [Levilactobacillus bambusae]|uniref:Transcriptional regulator Spx n=1 Tax=Levilactobacillus bambusae TaxID=2024736 RepID=A0A2V1N060_9LACO|nr:transcriptional regulator SpxA [Levilactobacillus bambusae]PWG00617.1 transcriptional regulator Spx [Levilactobacillus bambusae]